MPSASLMLQRSSYLHYRASSASRICFCLISLYQMVPTSRDYARVSYITSLRFCGLIHLPHSSVPHICSASPILTGLHIARPPSPSHLLYCASPTSFHLSHQPLTGLICLRFCLLTPIAVIDPIERNEWHTHWFACFAPLLSAQFRLPLCVAHPLRS